MLLAIPRGSFIIFTRTTVWSDPWESWGPLSVSAAEHAAALHSQYSKPWAAREPLVRLAPTSHLFSVFDCSPLQKETVVLRANSSAISHILYYCSGSVNRRGRTQQWWIIESFSTTWWSCLLWSVEVQRTLDNCSLSRCVSASPHCELPLAAAVPILMDIHMCSSRSGLAGFAFLLIIRRGSWTTRNL